jgi:Serine dehydrogenase proteinase
MGNWTDILNEINETVITHQKAAGSAHDSVRRRHLSALAAHTGRNTIAYYSAFLSKPRLEGIEVIDDDKNAFMNCIHGLDRTKGLDLLLHTPGGSIAATESLVRYLVDMFGNDIRAIIPQIAMSAGTMIACACKTIIMARHSNLGPIDPQVNGFPADVVRQEFQRAYDEIKADPLRAHIWAPILSRYPPSFISQCDNAVDWAIQFVEDALRNNMLAGHSDAAARATKLARDLSSSQQHKAHSKHLHYAQCDALGLTVQLLENDQELQERVLTVHHCYIHTTTNTPAVKIVENHEGRALVRNAQQMVAPPTLSIGFGGPP